MEAKPLQVVPSSHNNSSGEEGGCGPHKEIDMGQRMEGVVEMESVVGVVKEEEKSSSSFELDLGVGANYTATKPEADSEEALKPVITACNNRCCYLFTEAQRCELDHQVLIFNHFASNLPLPPHHILVVPFFNTASSGAGTLGSGFGNFCKQFPTYMSEYSSQGYYHGNMVDPELHRCRRTDGKKWRCGKAVVPNQKYCERHMHRGRNRSRKPVETSEVNSPFITKPCSKLHKKASNTESSVLSPNPLSIRHAETSSSTASRSLAIANASYANNRLKSVIDSSDYNILVAADNRSSRNICHRDNLTKSCTGNNVGVRSGGKGSITCDSNCISTGIGFSPRSVLQSNIVSGCNNPYLNDRNSTELEPGRCRRTDGKKWRCKSAALPGQKYCATHMHRGAKRRFADHELATTIATTSGVTDARLHHSTALTTNIQKARCAIPNANLSMSIPESEPLMQRIEESPSRSSDTDTTITDTMNEYSCASF